MARLKRKDGKLTAADLSSYGILPKQPDESKPVKSQESETLNGAAERSDSLLWESKANAEASAFSCHQNDMQQDRAKGGQACA
jgi:hypothetical protein